MNKVDQFLNKMKHWQNETAALRKIILQTKLEEEFKWSLPCYTLNGRNVVIIQPFKACLALMFFKGAAIKDSKKLLMSAGPNSQTTRRFEFKSVEEITKLSSTIKAYIKEAIEIEKSGKTIEIKNKPQSVPMELKAVFAKNAKLKKAFASLTPGRQRAYLMHFSGAKQSATRQSRIKKCIPGILEGKGLNER